MRNILDVHSSENLQVIVFNVGQGDHIMIKFPGNKYALLDFHYADHNSIKIHEPPALTYFRALKEALTEEEFKRISVEFMSLSHLHMDHIKGFSRTLAWLKTNEIEIKKVLLPDLKNKGEFKSALKESFNQLSKTLTREERKKYAHIINEHKSQLDELYEPQIEYKYNIKQNKIRDITRIHQVRGSDYKFDVVSLGPLQENIETASSKNYVNSLKESIKIYGGEKKISTVEVTHHQNSFSTVLWVKSNKQSLVFTGDAELEDFQAVIKKYNDEGYEDDYGPLGWNFLKVSHHGSVTGTNKEILEGQCEKGCQFAISAGRHPVFKHANSEVIKILAEETNSLEKIGPTNLCTHCYIKNGKVIDWYNAGRMSNYDSASNTSKETRERNRPKGYKQRKFSIFHDNPGLVGILYEFRDDKKLINSYNLACNHLEGYKICFYKDHEYGPREACSANDGTTAEV